MWATSYSWSRVSAKPSYISWQPISLETYRAHFWLHNSLSQQGHLDVRNFVVISFNFLPLQHMKRPALQNKRVGVLGMAFRARKVSGSFENARQIYDNLHPVSWHGSPLRPKRTFSTMQLWRLGIPFWYYKNSSGHHIPTNKQNSSVIVKHGEH